MFVGIDWGRNAHTIALLKDNGEIMKIFKIRNDYAGYIDLLKHLQGSSRVVFALEHRTHRLVDFLAAQGYSGFYVNPNAMPSYRSRYKSASVKSDELDAFILADLLRTDRHNLTEIILDTPFVRELKGLIVDREHYVRDETRLVNRLEGCLVEYYPEALKFFDNPASKVALEFWAAYPTLDDTRGLTVEDVESFLAAHKWYRGRDEVAKRIIKIVSGETIKVLNDVVRVKSRMLLGIVEQLKLLKKTIADYNQEIKRLVESKEDAGQYTSLPGAGSTLGPAIYTLFSGGIKFDRLVEIRAYVGTAPVTSQSGEFRGVSFRFACNHFYRNVFQRLAFCSLKESQWAMGYYRGKRREGKKHQHALRCLADLWVKVAYAMWRKKERYDEQKHLASMAQFWLSNNSRMKA